MSVTTTDSYGWSLALVSSFDLDCPAASVNGLRQYLRFLMHDSPRECDTEGPLFRRLFEIVHELETSSATRSKSPSSTL